MFRKSGNRVLWKNHIIICGIFIKMFHFLKYCIKVFQWLKLSQKALIVTAQRHESFWRWLDTCLVQYLGEISIWLIIWQRLAGLQSSICLTFHLFWDFSCTLFFYHLPFQVFPKTVFSFFCFNNAMKVLWAPLMHWIWTCHTWQQSIRKDHIQVKWFFYQSFMRSCMNSRVNS